MNTKRRCKLCLKPVDVRSAITATNLKPMVINVIANGTKLTRIPMNGENATTLESRK